MSARSSCTHLAAAALYRALVLSTSGSSSPPSRRWPKLKRRLAERTPLLSKIIGSRLCGGGGGRLRGSRRSLRAAGGCLGGCLGGGELKSVKRSSGLTRRRPRRRLP